VNPVAIYTAVKDLIILAVLAGILYEVYSFGADRVKLADMAALQKQMTANAAQVAAWQKESTDANTQRASELAQIQAGVDAHRDPIYIMRDAPGSGTVPTAATGAGCPAAAGGSAHAGPGSDPVDLRPQIALFEQRYERALADCRSVLNSWPRRMLP
jgi:hypothetical protein